MQAVKRTMRYAQAGVHMNAGCMMNVRSHVSLPDAEAGRERDTDRQAYVHTGPVPSSKRVIRIPVKWVAAMLGVLVLIFVYRIGGKLNQRASETKQISSMEQAIVATIRENMDLEAKIAVCRDSSRICYRAVQELGMVSSAAVNAVPVTAPDTRPYEPKTVSTSAASPVAAGLISGSR